MIKFIKKFFKKDLKNNNNLIDFNKIDKEDLIFIEQANKLKNSVKTLRAPNGCPWDRKLEIENCTEYILEETHEAIEAIDKNNMVDLCEELGDILSQVFMICQIASEKGHFNIINVFENINKKLIFRHPHVFANIKADNPDQVLEIWNKQKLKEKKERKNFLEGIPKTLPSIYFLNKLLRKLKHYPKIYDIIINKIKTDLKSVKENIDIILNYLLKNLSDDFEKSNEKDNEKNRKLLEDFLFIILFFGHLNEIDYEKILRKKIDEIYKIFEDNYKE